MSVSDVDAVDAAQTAQTADRTDRVSEEERAAPPPPTDPTGAIPLTAADRVFDRDAITAGALLLLCLGGLGLIHRGLATYDPSLGFEDGLSVTENLLFAPSGSSTTLNLCVMGWLLLSRRLHIWRSLGQPASLGLAIPLVGSGTSLAYWSYFVAAPDLLICALMLNLLGLAALVGGRSSVRAIALPAGFLVFMLMRPGVVVNQIVYPFQMVAAETSMWVLGVVQLEVHRFEDLLVTRERVFQVIEACSGLRITETLAMAALLYADLFRRGPRQALLLILVSPLIALVCNTLRIVMVILNPYSEIAEVHFTQGIVMVVVGVLGIAAFDSFTRRFDRQSGSSSLISRHRVTALPTQRLAVGAVVLIALGAGVGVIEVYEPVRHRWPLVSQLPTELGSWKAVKGLKIDPEYMGSAHATDWTRRLYQRGGDEAEAVEIFIGSDERRDRRLSLRSPKTERLGSGVSVAHRSEFSLEGAAGPMDLLLLTKVNKRWLALHWERGWSSFGVETAHALLALDQSPFRRPGRTIVVQVRTVTGPSTEELRGAELRLRSFLSESRAALAELEIPLGRDSGGSELSASGGAR